MAKRGQRTINRDSVFRRTSVEQEAPAQGLAAGSDETFQTNIWLTHEDVAWLDDRCQEIKRGGWRGVTRSAVVRSIIRALAREGSIDLSGTTDEDEIVQRLLEK